MSGVMHYVYTCDLKPGDRVRGEGQTVTVRRVTTIDHTYQQVDYIDEAGVERSKRVHHGTVATRVLS